MRACDHIEHAAINKNVKKLFQKKKKSKKEKKRGVLGVSPRDGTRNRAAIEVEKKKIQKQIEKRKNT